MQKASSQRRLGGFFDRADELIANGEVPPDWLINAIARSSDETAPLSDMYHPDTLPEGSRDSELGEIAKSLREMFVGMEEGEREELENQLLDLKVKADARDISEAELERCRHLAAKASEISEAQGRLSRPARYLAIVLSTVAMGGTFGSAMYTVADSATERGAQSENQVHLTEGEVRGAAAIVGGSGAIMGLVIGAGLSARRTGRMAKRRAQKIVKRAAAE